MTQRGDGFPPQSLQYVSTSIQLESEHEEWETLTGILGTPAELRVVYYDQTIWLEVFMDQNSVQKRLERGQAIAEQFER